MRPSSRLAAPARVTPAPLRGRAAARPVEPPPQKAKALANQVSGLFGKRGTVQSTACRGLVEHRLVQQFTGDGFERCLNLARLLRQLSQCQVDLWVEVAANHRQQ